MIQNMIIVLRNIITSYCLLILVSPKGKRIAHITRTETRNCNKIRHKERRSMDELL